MVVQEMIGRGRTYRPLTSAKSGDVVEMPSVHEYEYEYGRPRNGVIQLRRDLERVSICL